MTKEEILEALMNISHGITEGMIDNDDAVLLMNEILKSNYKDWFNTIQ